VVVKTKFSTLCRLKGKVLRLEMTKPINTPGETELSTTESVAVAARARLPERTASPSLTKTNSALIRGD
jgi:hypothetical protein